MNLELIVVGIFFIYKKFKRNVSEFLRNIVGIK